MTFALPWALAGLLVVPALLAAYRRVRAARQTRAVTTVPLATIGSPTKPTTSIATGATGGSGRPGRSGGSAGRDRLAPTLLLLGLALLVVAAARPQATVRDIHREGTVILAFDVSRSMTATDLAPSRLEAAKSAAKAFVSAAPAEIRIGVVAFGDGGVVAGRPSTVPGDAVAAIDRLAPQGGTSLGQGIYTSLGAIAGGKLDIPPEALAGDLDQLDIGYLGSAVVVLLSDGEDRSRLDPVKLAELASVAGVRIDTVGLGDPRGTTLTVDGVSVATALDEQLLTRIAETTGGHYRRAPDAAALAEIYSTIDLKLTATPAPAEISALFAAAALLLVVLGAARAVLRTGRLV
jgi:Ca-activated chloride channel family protein